VRFYRRIDQSNDNAKAIANDKRTNQLLINDAAILFLPFPHLLHESVPAERAAIRHALLVQRFLNDSLCSNASVVQTRYPHRGFTFHAFVTDQRVLERHSQRMTDVQIA
jgi:hypothetical protein